MDDVVVAGLRRNPNYEKWEAVIDLRRAEPQARQPHPDTIAQHIKMHADHMAGQDAPGQVPPTPTDKRAFDWREVAAPSAYAQMVFLQADRLTDDEWTWLFEKTWR
jgi:hypothetical protein